MPGCALGRFLLAPSCAELETCAQIQLMLYDQIKQARARRGRWLAGGAAG
jgi:hypothetical protein